MVPRASLASSRSRSSQGASRPLKELHRRLGQHQENKMRRKKIKEAGEILENLEFPLANPPPPALDLPVNVLVGVCWILHAPLFIRLPLTERLEQAWELQLQLWLPVHNILFCTSTVFLHENIAISNLVCLMSGKIECAKI